MKRVFRSIINIKKSGNPTIAPDELVRNYKAFLGSKLNPEDPSYIKMMTWIEAHFRQFREIPSFELLYERAQADGDETVLANLKDIATQQPYIRSDYLVILKEKVEEQNKTEFQALIQRTYTAASSSLKIKAGGKKKEKEISGIGQAIEYFTSESRRFRLNSLGLKTDSQIRSTTDGTEVIESYKSKKKDPISNLGLFTQLDKIDTVLRGTKLGELLIVAAYVAQGKTTMVANLAYNGIMQGLNGLYVSLEMNFEEMRNMIYCLHTSNPDWYRHPKYKNLAGKLSYEKICYGELDDMEQEFFEAASENFVTNDYGELIIFQPTEHMTPSHLEMELYDRRAELAERGKTLDFVVIDYVGLMVQDKADRYGDFNIDLNNIIKRLKNISINFDNGRGIRVITPFQINREGWKDAIKNEGVYKLTALSNANEAERAADQVITLYFSDDMKKSGVVKITCLKHRKGNTFPPFEAHIDFVTKRISDFFSKSSSVIDDDMAIQEIPTDVR
jgi:replicative DNA helicase